METQQLDRLVGIAKYAFKGLTSGLLIVMVPDIAQGTGHGTMTLVFSGLALLVIWGTK